MKSYTRYKRLQKFSITTKSCWKMKLYLHIQVWMSKRGIFVTKTRRASGGATFLLWALIFKSWKFVSGPTSYLNTVLAVVVAVVTVTVAIIGKIIKEYLKNCEFCLDFRFCRKKFFISGFNFLSNPLGGSHSACWNQSSAFCTVPTWKEN